LISFQDEEDSLKNKVNIIQKNENYNDSPKIEKKKKSFKRLSLTPKNVEVQQFIENGS
jgi:hypothetical protein